MNTDNYYPMEGGLNISSIIRQVYIWMVLGMLLSTVVALFNCLHAANGFGCESNRNTDRRHR